ncbi:MAG: DUF4367 domain-containing protein [Ruminococcus sp.]|nr:DUF4367 domain-containing protein [Ruminococcus sp.]
MTEKEYKQCIAQALCPEYEAMLCGITSEHTFSHGFEKQMDKLIKRRGKPYYSLVNTVGKRVAVIILAFVMVSFTTVMSVEALRKPFISFITNMFSSHSEIRSDPDDSKQYPATIESKYDITEGVDGYKVILEEQYDNNRTLDYSKDNIVVSFEQHIVDDFDMHTNTEGATIEHIDINGHEAIGWFDNHNYYHMIWNNGEYVIVISSNIGRNELIGIAKSVQKVE